FSVGGAGSHSLTFWSVDQAGNSEAARGASFQIDSAAPGTTASLSGPQTNGWYSSSSVGVRLSAADATSGVAATSSTVAAGLPAALPTSFSVGGAGSHSLTFWSVDQAGNSEAARGASFQIDSAAPGTTDSLSGPQTNGWYSSSPVGVSLSAADATSGVAATYYTVDGGSAPPYSAPFSVGGAGTHDRPVGSVDQAGNSEAAHGASFQIDSAAPGTTDSLSGPQTNGWYSSSPVGVSLSAADATSGVAATYYTVDGGSATLYSAPFSVGGAGSHSLTFWSVDQAGNSEAAHGASFQIDSAAPGTTASLSATPGSNGWYTSSPV